MLGNGGRKTFEQRLHLVCIPRINDASHGLRRVGAVHSERNIMLLRYKVVVKEAHVLLRRDERHRARRERPPQVARKPPAVDDDHALVFGLLERRQRVFRGPEHTRQVRLAESHVGAWLVGERRDNRGARAGHVPFDVGACAGRAAERARWLGDRLGITGGNEVGMVAVLGRLREGELPMDLLSSLSRRTAAAWLAKGSCSSWLSCYRAARQATPWAAAALKARG